MVTDTSSVNVRVKESPFALYRYHGHHPSSFFTLTSHPKTPDRTAAEAGRHVSRNIHNTGNFAASRENMDKNGGCRKRVAAEFTHTDLRSDQPSIIPCNINRDENINLMWRLHCGWLGETSFFFLNKQKEPKHIFFCTHIYIFSLKESRL